MQNISKFVNINNFLVLEYVFNKELNYNDIDKIDENDYFNRSKTEGHVSTFPNNSRTLIYHESSLNEGQNVHTRCGPQTLTYAKGINMTQWAFSGDGVVSDLLMDHKYTKIEKDGDEEIIIDFDNDNTTYYCYDTVRIHVLSGYNFQGIFGFELGIYGTTPQNTKSYVNTYCRSNINHGHTFWNNYRFNSTPLNISGKFYDKCLEFKVPSISFLGTDQGRSTVLGKLLDIKKLSDINIEYRDIETVATKTVVVDEDNYITKEYFQYEPINTLEVSLPVESIADNFNAKLVESTSGDYLEFFATWNGSVIGNYIDQIESGAIPLYTYTSNNDFQDFIDVYGLGTRKWVIYHDINVYQISTGSVSTKVQSISFLQDADFNTPLKYRPILKDTDMLTHYFVEYVCRLSNRMDGTQITRRVTFVGEDAKKYGQSLQRINVATPIIYKVNNKIIKQ